MLQEYGQCCYFIIPTLADLSCTLRKAVSEALAVFLLNVELLLSTLKTGKSNMSVNKNQGKIDFDWSNSLGDHKMDIISRLVSTTAIFLRKSELVRVLVGVA
jgi:hypothetical protein